MLVEAQELIVVDDMHQRKQPMFVDPTPSWRFPAGSARSRSSSSS